jgi:hypothetical protein
MVDVMPWPLTPSETTLTALKTGGCVDPGMGPNMAERKIFTSQETKLQISNCTAHFLVIVPTKQPGWGLFC